MQALAELTALATEHADNSCGNCRFGYAPESPAPPADMPLYAARLWLWRTGQAIFCDCDAGRQAQRGMESMAERQEQHDQTLVEEAQRARRARLERIFSDAQVPERFATLTAASYAAVANGDSGKQAAITAVKEYFRNGCITVGGATRFGLYFFGPTDQGKTGLLCPLFLSYIRAGHSGLWVQYNDLQASLRDWESGKVQERIEAAQHVEYLFIDDWGDPMSDRVATDYSRDTMFRIIDYRNNYRKPTFVTSNLSPTQLSGQFHDRIGKRLAELCAMIELSGTPMRELARRNEKHMGAA